MAATALTPVTFHGASLFVTTINGAPFVVLKPVVEAIGLAWESQLLRIKRHAVLSTCMIVTNMQMPGDDQAREVVMLPLSKLNGWLFGVSVRRVKPELRERLTQYQAECFDVLASHFGVHPPVAAIPTPEPKPEPVTAASLVNLLLGDCLSERAVLDIAMAASKTLFRKSVMKPNGYGDQVARKINDKLPQADLYAILVAASMEMELRVIGAKMELEKAA